MFRRNSTYCYVCPTFFVNSVHVKLELWPMPISVPIVVGQKKEGMYHFML